MAEPFLGEIRLMSFAFAPNGWAPCNGQLLPINQNQALFSLLGTTYGGNGTSNFGLPDLRGRTPIHVGGGHARGASGGEQAHTLSAPEMPSHTHQLAASSKEGNAPIPAAHVLAASSSPIYHAPDNLVALSGGSVTSTGGSQPHTNMQPFLTVSFCMALQGIYPSPN